MVPFERAFASSYRPSIVTFHLSLHISEIFPLLSSSRQLFPTLPLVSPNFPMFSWEVDGLWAAKSESVGLSVRAISFQDFQPMWSWSTNVRERRTDGQTDRQTDDMLSQYRALHYSTLRVGWRFFYRRYPVESFRTNCSCNDENYRLRRLSFDIPSPRNSSEYPHIPYISRN